MDFPFKMVFTYRLPPPMLLIMAWSVWGAGVAHSQHWLHLSSPVPILYGTVSSELKLADLKLQSTIGSVYLGSSSLQRQGQANFSCFLYTVGKRSQDTSGTILCPYPIFQENTKKSKTNSSFATIYILREVGNGYFKTLLHTQHAVNLSDFN